MNFYSPPFPEVAFNQYYTSYSHDIFLSQPLPPQSSFFDLNATISLPELDGTLQDPLLNLDFEPVQDLPDTSSKQSTFKLSNLPKRPPNAFILFRRSLALNRNKSMSFVEFSKSAGIRWKEMTTDEKKDYEEEANELREKFKQKYPGFKVKYKSRGNKK
jgi:hypothetical protein